MSKNEAFLDENYEVPTSGGGFTKLELGENRFRILSSPLLLWVVWLDGSPSRVKYTGPDSKPAKGAGQKDSVKHAWGLVVWNYKTEAIEVFELDKQDVISSLATHAKDADWGHPKGYDVVITKKGSGMDTEYSLIAKPHTAPAQVIIDGFVETPINLANLLTDASPFLTSAGSPESTTEAAPAKVVTAENWTKGDAIPAGYIANGEGIVKKTLPF